MQLSKYFKYLKDLDMKQFKDIYKCNVLNITVKYETIIGITMEAQKTTDNSLYCMNAPEKDTFLKKIYIYYLIPNWFNMEKRSELEDVIASILIRDNYKCIREDAFNDKCTYYVLEADIKEKF